MNGIEVIIFGIKLTVKPIAFTLKLGNFEWNIYWYGILIALGFLLAVIYALRNYKRFNLDVDRMLDVVLVTVPVSILCARIYYVLFDGVKVKYKRLFWLWHIFGTFRNRDLRCGYRCFSHRRHYVLYKKSKHF